MLIESPHLQTPPGQGDVTEFRARVESLYADVQRWLGDAEPGCTFARSSVELNEMATGPYTMPVLEVTRPSAGPMRFVPRARYMLGGCGLVEISSNLGEENLIWVFAGAPDVSFKYPEGPRPIEQIGQPTYPGLPEGWTWSDDRHLDLVHLDRDVFLNRIVEALS